MPTCFFVYFTVQAVVDVQPILQICALHKTLAVPWQIAVPQNTNTKRKKTAKMRKQETHMVQHQTKVYSDLISWVHLALNSSAAKVQRRLCMATYGQAGMWWSEIAVNATTHFDNRLLSFNTHSEQQRTSSHHEQQGTTLGEAVIWYTLALNRGRHVLTLSHQLTSTCEV